MEKMKNKEGSGSEKYTSSFFSVDQLGAIGDGEADDTAAVEKAIQLGLEKSGVVSLSAGKTYRITKNLSFKAGNRSVNIFSPGSGDGKAKLLFDIKKGIAINFSGESNGPAKALVKNEKAGTKFLHLSDMKDVEPGQLCEIMSTKAWYHDPRPPANPPTRWVGYNQGSARNGTKNSMVLSEEFRAAPEDAIGRHFTILDGPNRGHSATVTQFKKETKEIQFTPPFPSAITPDTAYLFPQAFKGELNVVARKENERIELRSILFDGYHVKDDRYGEAKEKVTAEFFNPVSVLMENVELDWIPSKTNSGFEMIRVVYGNNCIFRNVTINEARRIGFQIERCFNTLIEACGVSHSNNNFLGYGVNVQNSTECTIKNSWFWGCRRGVDFDSVRDFVNAYPSRLGTVDTCINYGGGIREPNRPREAPWYPEGDWAETKAHNFGFGSHGPADHMNYINNTIINTYRGIFLRGTNERILNNKFIGKMQECIGIWFGGNHTVEGNEYIHPAMSGELEGLENYRETLDFEGSSFRKDFPLRFIGVAILNHSPISYQRGSISVRNNIARGVRKDFFFHQWSAGKYMEDIQLENNHVTIWPEDEKETVHFVNSNHSGEIRNFLDNNNHINVKAGNFYPYRLRNTFGENCRITPHDSLQRKWHSDESREIKTQSGFNPKHKPLSKSGESLGHIITRPYSRLSKFRCRFDGSASRSDKAGGIVVALFRGVICISAKLVYCPAKDIPVDLSLEYIDQPNLHEKVKYSVRMGPVSGELGEVVVNDSKMNFGERSHASLIVEEI